MSSRPPADSSTTVANRTNRPETARRPPAMRISGVHRRPMMVHQEQMTAHQRAVTADRRPLTDHQEPPTPRQGPDTQMEPRSTRRARRKAGKAGSTQRHRGTERISLCHGRLARSCRVAEGSALADKPPVAQQVEHQCHQPSDGTRRWSLTRATRPVSEFVGATAIR